MAIISEDARVGKETLAISVDSSAKPQPGSPRQDDDASSTDAGSATYLPTPSSPGARWCDMASEASEDTFDLRDGEFETKDPFELREVEFETKECVVCQGPGARARPKTFQDEMEEMMQRLCATLQLFWCCAGSSCAWSDAGRSCTVQAVIPVQNVPYVQQLLSVAKSALVARTSSRITLLGTKAWPFVQTSTGFSAYFSEMVNRQTACWDSFMYGQCKRGRRCPWEHPANIVTLNFVVMAIAWQPPRVLQVQPPADAQTADEGAKQ